MAKNEGGTTPAVATDGRVAGEPESRDGDTSWFGRLRRNPRIDQYLRTAHFLRQNKLAMVGLGILLLFVAVALYSPFYPGPNDTMALYCGTYSPGGAPTNTSACVCTYPQGQGSSPPGCYSVPPNQPSLVAPTLSLNPLGVGPLPLGSLTQSSSSSLFYNTATGLIKGAPWSLSISVAVVGSGALIGLLLGAAAGYRGGIVDEVIMRFTDIFLSIPAILLTLVVLTAVGSLHGFNTGLGSRLTILVLTLVVTWWPFYTRLVRGQVLVVREQKYVEAARASGAGTARILFKHIIPNSAYPVFVQMSLDVGTVPLLLGVIIYLGYPIWPTALFPEWGTISARAVSETFLSNQVLLCSIGSCSFPWWQVLFPGLVVFLFAISVNFLSDGLRDALDPRLRR
ncbi:MAG: ABC transporter permease [Thermoplasmata archaeon]|nr:ABC transporter permease [Thermoplasmata archaeon]